MVLAPAVAIRPLLAQGTVEGIASQLICLCGCGKLLSVCEMDTAKQMKSIISDRLAEGMTAREVIDYMTEKYGEQVLAAPTKKGFNLTAWITPFAGIFVGSLVIWLVVAAWVQRRRVVRATEVATVVSEDLESRYGTILEQELDEFEA
jgi:cytochrome c-type biogenesis protein CcmH